MSIEIVFFMIMLGVITGIVASMKGRSFFLWWIYGALLFIVAIIHIALLPSKTEPVRRDSKASNPEPTPSALPKTVLQKEAEAKAKGICPLCESEVPQKEMKQYMALKICPSCWELKQ